MKFLQDMATFAEAVRDAAQLHPQGIRETAQPSAPPNPSPSSV